MIYIKYTIIIFFLVFPKAFADVFTVNVPAPFVKKQDTKNDYGLNFHNQKNVKGTHVKTKKINSYAFSVNAIPKSSKIRILNIIPKYKKGIKLTSGRYLIEVKKEGYKTLKKWVKITDSNTRIFVKLKKKRKLIINKKRMYSLKIDVTPQFSRIKILNIKLKYHRGITLTSGKYQIQVSKKGYKTLTQWVSLNKNKTLKLFLKKKRAPQIAKATASTIVNAKHKTTFRIQYGIFLSASSSFERANKLHQTMKSEGYHSNITLVSRRNKKYYRIWVSTFTSSRKKAKAIQKKMKRRYPKNFYVQNSMVFTPN